MKLTKRVLFFIAFEMIFCATLGYFLVFHGPFVNVKETFVTSAMATMRHQYLARIFLSDDEINKIIKKNEIDNITEREKINDIKTAGGSSNVNIVNIQESRFKGYLMIVDDPKRVRVATADNLGEKGMTLSQIVKKYNALGGINAGGFSDATGVATGGTPEGIIVENHKIVHKDSANKYGIIGFNSDNVFVVGEYSYDQIVKDKIRDAVVFGPPLVINGKPMITSGNGGKGIQPRTAIGQRKDGAVLLLVIDGRRADSIGATLKDVQDIFLEYGAYNAANLDGGSSATMSYNGKIVNKPSDILGERSIPSAFVVE